MAERPIGIVHYFILDTLADWEASYALSVLNTPIGEPLRRYRVVTVAESREPITTMAGLKVTPETTLDAVSPKESALLVLPGAGSWTEGGNRRALEKSQQFADAGTPVAAICGATWGLARSGLLDDRRHTSNAPEFLASSDYRGAGRYVNERAVRDRGVITAGAVGALEFAREIFLELEYYSPRVIEAWYQLYRTGDPRYYAELTNASAPSA
jgi:putative intracellular protease/amidase